MDLKELQNQLLGLVALGRKAIDAGDMEKYAEIKGQIDELKAQIKALQELEEAKAVATPAAPPKTAPAALPLSPDNGGEPEAKSAEQLAEETRKEFAENVRVLRYGKIDETKSAIARQILDADYLQLADEQEQQFKSYLRFGDVGCATRGISLKSLGRQVWDLDAMAGMLKDGMSVAEIKATMIEGADVLGGYAVPPQRANEILRRMRGLTAVRDAGALVIQTAGDSIEWLKVRGYNTGGSASDQYPSGLRGDWGSETVSPSEKNFEFAAEKINVEVYSFKVPMSVSLVQDAPNVVDILTGLIADTMAIDEDAAFITGDGANKPRGLLPGSDNVHSFTEQASGVSASIEVATTKAARRQIASQYRANGRANWLFNSDTASVVETWQDGIGRFYFETTEKGDMLFRFRVQESESMPDLASSAYAVLFGDFSGYAIVERLGMSVVRFMDSNTTINEVEYQVRRRIGGDVIEPYKFAVIKCGA